MSVIVGCNNEGKFDADNSYIIDESAVVSENAVFTSEDATVIDSKIDYGEAKLHSWDEEFDYSFYLREIRLEDGDHGEIVIHPVVFINLADITKAQQYNITDLAGSYTIVDYSAFK